MKNFNTNRKSIQPGIRDIRAVTLSQNEKDAVLAKILGHVRENEAESSPAPHHSWQTFFRREWGIYVLALCSLVLVLGGIGYKAEASLPGEPLYAVKVGITEPIRANLAVGPAAEARFVAEKVNRRLGEAESLALQSRLTSALATSLLSNVESGVEHVGLLDQALAKEGDASDVGDTSSSLEATLDAHSRILSVVADHSDSSDKNELARLQLAVTKDAHTESAPVAMNAPAMKFSTFAAPVARSLPSTPSAVTASSSATTPQNPKPMPHAYAAKKQDVVDSIREAQDEINSAPISQNPLIQAIIGSAHVLLDGAKNSLEVSSIHYSSGDMGGASVSLHQSKQAVEEALISVKQSIQLGNIGK